MNNCNYNNANKSISKSVSYEETDYDSESEEYEPISDGEFELEKCIINDKAYSKSNKKTSDGEDDCASVNTDERKIENNISMSIDDDEVYDLLEKAYEDKHFNPDEKKKKTVSRDNLKEHERDRMVLEEVSKNHFDILPENWIETTHESGMPIYLHNKSRVVTLSRPYFLGSGDPRSHLAPLSAISCLQYQKSVQSKESIKNEPDFQVSKLGDMIIPNAKVETAQENIIKESLTHEELREYCQSLFKFKQVSRSPHGNQQNVISGNSNKKPKTVERPSLPDSTKLITIPVQTEDHDQRCNRRREWIMNPNGKNYVTILHDYLQQVLKTQPGYEFEELKSTETTYSATVVFNDVKYGVGLGNNKKQAKMNAAQATLDILIPEMMNKIDSDQQNQCSPVIFDQLKVTDPRIYEFCVKTSEPSPYNMLLLCLQINIVHGQLDIKYELNKRRWMLYRCTMMIGTHVASVLCRNKRDGKQKASQVILSLLHPHIDNWGSLIRLYGHRSIDNAKKKKQEERKITQLQNKRVVNEPNFAVLNKLTEDMLKIRDQRRLKESLGSPHSVIASACPHTIVMPSESEP